MAAESPDAGILISLDPMCPVCGSESHPAMADRYGGACSPSCGDIHEARQEAAMLRAAIVEWWQERKSAGGVTRIDKQLATTAGIPICRRGLDTVN